MDSSLKLTKEQIRNKDVVKGLKKIKFIGQFPEAVDVLLVSVANGWEEAKVVDPELTKTQFLSLLKKEGVFVFRDVEHYFGWKKQLKSA